jgi:superfamily II DNA or RNA helicase
MITLRPYQGQAIDELREAFAKGHKRVVLCLPTGAGKTVVFSEMVRLANERGTKTLVLTDRTELFKQTIKALGRVGVAVEEIAPHRKEIYAGATIYLAMVETFKRRKHLFSFLTPGLIIIDEAHKGNFNDIITLFPESRVIGATATPVGPHFFELYTHIVQNIDVPDLIEQGSLSRCKPYQMVDDFSDLQVKRGEYTGASLDLHYNKPTLYKGVVENYLKYAKGKKTIVFNVSIEHTKNVNQAFLDAGISSDYITSKTSTEDRTRILNAFSSGAFHVLNNCGILTTGYDEPSIECVIVNRATKSLPLWLQCVGRGSRVIPGVKDSFVLLDFGGNHARLGLWNEPREWKLKKPREKAENEAAVKVCPQCEFVNFASARTCKGEDCDYVFPAPPKEDKQGVMVEVAPHVPDALKGKRPSTLTIDELIELQHAKKYKATYIWRIVRSRGESALEEYAHKMGYAKGWVLKQKQDTRTSDFNNYILS